MTRRLSGSFPGSLAGRADARRVAVAGLAGLALIFAGCGDDDDAPPPPSQAARPTAAATPGAVIGAPGAANKNQLAAKPHVEDRVGCPIPEQPSDPKGGACDPKAPSCAEHLYCLPLPQGNYCEPCPERDGIRHAFKERDFDPEHNRDPFQSVLVPLGPTAPADAKLTKKCPREDQLVATSYSYSELKLVGIVAQGTQRRVLMMGGPLGYIIKRGDCVGKEKAVVKDIGLGYVTFQLDPDEVSIQLNPKQLTLSEPELPGPAPRTTIAPAAPPLAVVPPRAPGASPPGAPSAGSGSAAPVVEQPAAPLGAPAPSAPRKR